MLGYINRTGGKQEKFIIATTNISYSLIINIETYLEDILTPILNELKVDVDAINF